MTERAQSQATQERLGGPKEEEAQTTPKDNLPDQENAKVPLLWPVEHEEGYIKK